MILVSVAQRGKLMSIGKMSKTVLKSIFGKSACLMYPIVSRQFVEGTRGQISIDSAQCIYCGICQKKCPTDAIVVEKKKSLKDSAGVVQESGQNLWQIDRLRCITCNYCVEACPKKCLHMDRKYSASCVSKETELYTVK